MQLIHTDICGPLPVLSHNRSKYLLTFTDDYSRYTWVFFLKKKSQAFEVFKQFKVQVEKECQCEIAALRSDRGGEYLSYAFKAFCQTLGIKRQLTVSHSPHQNGIAERKNRTLFDCGRSLTSGSKLPSYLWEEVIRAANFILNRCPTKPIKGCVPFEKLKGMKPNLGNAKVIGCLAYVFIRKEKRDKLKPTAIKTVLLGYDDESKAYRCYDAANKKIYICKDVLFDEATPGYQVSADETTFEDQFMQFELFEDEQLEQPVGASEPSTFVPANVSDNTLLDHLPELPIAPSSPDIMQSTNELANVPEPPSETLIIPTDPITLPLSESVMSESIASYDTPLEILNDDSSSSLQSPIVVQKSKLRAARQPKPLPPRRIPSQRI